MAPQIIRTNDSHSYTEWLTTARNSFFKMYTRRPKYGSVDKMSLLEILLQKDCQPFAVGDICFYKQDRSW